MNELPGGQVIISYDGDGGELATALRFFLRLIAPPSSHPDQRQTASSFSLQLASLPPSFTVSLCSPARRVHDCVWDHLAAPPSRQGRLHLCLLDEQHRSVIVIMGVCLALVCGCCVAVALLAT